MSTRTRLAIYYLVLAASIAVMLVIAGRPEQFDSDGWTTEILDEPAAVDPAAIDEYSPKHRLTPGAIYRQATLAEIRRPNYSASVRDVTEATKREVMRRYGLDQADESHYEIDHLIPLCIGGSNDQMNLWPQPYEGEWNARVKDKLERHLLALVREGTLPLREAQHRIAADWRKMYRDVIGEEPSPAFTTRAEQ